MCGEVQKERLSSPCGGEREGSQKKRNGRGQVRAKMKKVERRRKEYPKRELMPV